MLRKARIALAVLFLLTASPNLAFSPLSRIRRRPNVKGPSRIKEQVELASIAPISNHVGLQQSIFPQKVATSRPKKASQARTKSESLVQSTIFVLVWTAILAVCTCQPALAAVSFPTISMPFFRSSFFDRFSFLLLPFRSKFYVGSYNRYSALVQRYLEPYWITMNRHKRKSIFIIWLVYSLIHTVRVKRRQHRDATSEWERYAKKPGARGRALVNLFFFKVAPMYTLAKLLFFAKPLQRRLYTQSGNLLSTGLLQIGPLYIKLAQIISSQAKQLPAEWNAPLERLQDQVPAKSGQDALELAFKAWPGGQEFWLDAVAKFDATPIAAASLGQVHLAKLSPGAREASTRYYMDSLNSDGSRGKENIKLSSIVAIKLQRPFLREIYDQDLQLLKGIAKQVDKWRLGKGMDQSWMDIVKNAEAILYREIDYRDEAENGARFCEDFGLGPRGTKVPKSQITTKAKNGQPMPSAAPWLRAPFVYKNLSSEKVLVMEYVPSIKITNIKKMQENSVSMAEREYLAECLGRAYLRQFCSHLFFSADPHAGNLGIEILSTDTSLPPEQRVRLVFYDFGQAATLTQGQADGILDIMEAIVDSNVEKSVESFATMGVLKSDADLDVVRAKVGDNFKTGKIKANRKRLEKRGYKFKGDATAVNGAVTSDSIQQQEYMPGNINATVVPDTTVSDSQVMRYFTLPTEYAFVGRALTQMNGVGIVLDPDFDFISAAAPYIVEIKGADQYIKDEANKWFSNLLKSVEKVFPKYKKS